MFGLNPKFNYLLTMAMAVVLIIFIIASFSIGIKCANDHLAGNTEACKNDVASSSRDFLWAMFVPTIVIMGGYTAYYGWTNREVLSK